MRFVILSVTSSSALKPPTLERTEHARDPAPFATLASEVFGDMCSRRVGKVSEGEAPLLVLLGRLSGSSQPKNLSPEREF